MKQERFERFLPQGLQTQLDALVASAPTRLISEHRSILDRNVRRLKASRTEELALGVGDTAPDFALMNQHRKIIRLADRLALGPVVLIFFRGPWCPYCSVTLKAWEGHLGGLHKAGASLLAISPQTPESCSRTAETEGLSYDLLSDLGSEIAGAFHVLHTVALEVRKVYLEIGISLLEHNGGDGNRLPMAATFVIDPSFAVSLADVHGDPTTRLDPVNVVSALSKFRLNDR